MIFKLQEIFSKRKTIIVSSIIAVLFILPLVLPGVLVASASGGGCKPAGSTGLTALIVISSSGSKVTGRTINATGCDVGIYVSPGLSDIVIKDNTIWGASQHGIFVQDSWDITIVHNLVTNNGAGSLVCPPTGSPPPGCIPENKPIELVGTSGSMVAWNVVSHNSADGGIGVADDGAQNPGAPLGVAGKALAAKNDVVLGNTIVDNTRGCGIVIAVYNQGLGATDILVKDNTIIGQAPGTPIVTSSGPFIGQIVVATDGPFASMSEVNVVHNSLDGAFLPGIVVHANVFGDSIVKTRVVNNVIAETGYYPGPPNATSNTPGVVQGTTGISIVAENPWGSFPPAVISHTLVSSNRVLSTTNGVWLCYTTHTTVMDEHGNPTNPTATCAAGGS